MNNTRVLTEDSMNAVELTDAELATINGAGGCHGCHNHHSHSHGLLNLNLKLKLKVNLDDLLGDDCYDYCD